MKYLGIVKRQNENLTMPDAFHEVAQEQEFDAIQVGGETFLVRAPLDRERLKRLEDLANLSIEEHRSTLEGLAR